MANSIRRVFMSEVPTIGKNQTLCLLAAELLYKRGWFKYVFSWFNYALCLLNLLIWCNVLVCQLSIGFRLMPTPLCYMMSLLHTEWVRKCKIFHITLLIVLSAVIMLLFHRANSTHKRWNCWQDAVLTSKCIKHPASISVFMIWLVSLYVEK